MLPFLSPFFCAQRSAKRNETNKGNKGNLGKMYGKVKGKGVIFSSEKGDVKGILTPSPFFTFSSRENIGRYAV